jgi:hypothetical protein
MEIHCPNPTRVGRHDLIGFGMAISAIATVAASELFKDDVPVGRFRRHKLLSLQGERESQHSH